MFSFFKTKIGIITVGIFALMLILAMTFTSIVSINSIENFGKFAIKVNLNNIRSEALNSMQANTEETAEKYSLFFRKTIVLSSILAGAFQERYRNLNWFADKNKDFADTLKYIPLNGFFANPEKSVVRALNNGDFQYKELPVNIKTELNALSTLNPFLIDMKNVSTHYKSVWTETVNNTMLFYPADVLYPEKFAPHTRFEFLATGRKIKTSQYIGNIKTFKDIHNTEISQPYISPDGTLTLSTISRFHNKNGKYQGVVGIEIDLKSLFENYPSVPEPKHPVTQRILIKDTQSQTTFIVNENGTILIFSKNDLKLLGIDNSVIEKAVTYKDIDINLKSSSNSQVRNLMRTIAKEEQGVAILNLDNKNYYLAFALIKSTDWNLVRLVPESKLLSSIYKTQKQLESTETTMLYHFISITAAFFIIFIIIATILFNYYFLDPVQRLIKGLRSIASGNLKYRINIRRGKEIEEAAVTFNDMARDMDLSRSKLEQHKNKLEKTIRERTRELRITNEQLEVAKNNAEIATETKSRFLANMSHEIRTPMNAILGFSEILKEKINDLDIKRDLSIILSSGKTLLRLINDILDISKVEAGKLELKYEPTNLHFLLKELKQVFEENIKRKNLDFILEIAPTIPECVMIDSIRIRQILINLISNALKFTEKGYIKLTAGGKLSQNQHVLNLIMRIEDTGKGIPEEQQKTIFEAFTQQKGQDIKYGGTGLGLTIAKQLAEAMNGTISVTSKSEKGSSFEVQINDIEILKDQSQTADKADNKISDINSIEFDHANILVVDDSCNNRAIIKGFLATSRVNFTEAENGKEAIDKIKFQKPDLIIMDMRMPVMNGNEATAIIKEDKTLSNIPVIIVTASIDKTQEAESIKAGCDAFLRKPVSKQELINELVKFLAYTIKGTTQKTAVTEQIDIDKIDISLNDETRKRLPELTELLRGELFTEWKSIRNTYAFHKIKCFAEQIIGLGTTYNIKLLNIWGKELLSKAENFDKDLTSTLNDYPKLIEKISKLSETSDEE